MIISHNSFGNTHYESVCCGWFWTSLLDVEEKTRKVTEVTNDRPEGIKGTEDVAPGIFLPRIYRCKMGNSKSRIK